MAYHIDSVKFSRLPPDMVQDLLILFYQNTQPQNLKYEPKVVEYNDTKVMYTIKLHYIRISVSVDFLLKNLNAGLNPFFEELNAISNNSNKMAVGNMEYLDYDILKVAFYSVVIRIDSINRLVPGGTREFVRLKGIGGVTNGRLLIMSEMRDNPLQLDHVITNILRSKGFEPLRDYVHGYSCHYERKDYWKPIEWCVVPWLKSVITPFGFYVKFLKPMTKEK